MFSRLLNALALAAVLALSCLCLVQPAHGQTVEPYGTYVYTPGAYDYSSSPPSYNGTSTPTYSFGSSFGNPTYSRYGYTPGAYDNSSPTTGARPSYFYTTYNYAAPPDRSATMPLQPARRADDRTVRIQVRVPADARIWFDGEPTTQRGEVRTFESPALDPAKRYAYEIRATWQEGGRAVERTRQLRVRAGDRINVNLAGPDTARTTGR
jgi:uncharacterized protein (TIGR03000 family)